MSVKEQKEQEAIWLQQGDPYEGFDEMRRDHEINSLLDHIKEEFFDNRIRAFKLTKMGLIQLLPYLKDNMALEFIQHLKNESVVIELI